MGHLEREAPEAEGEFGEGNELLQDLREHEAIVDLTEYPEVQRNS
jgi:hypothetical protein